MKPVSDQGGMSNLHRQAGANLMHPRRNTWPRDRDHRRGACTGRCLLLSALRTKVRHRVKVRHRPISDINRTLGPVETMGQRNRD
jgi:hypothetical protein